MNISIKLLLIQLILRNITTLIGIGTNHNKDSLQISLHSINAICILILIYTSCYFAQQKLILELMLQTIVILNFEISFMDDNIILNCTIIVFLIQMQLYLNKQNIYFHIISHLTLIYAFSKGLIQYYNELQVSQLILFIILQPLNHYLLYNNKYHNTLRLIKLKELQHQLQTTQTPQFLNSHAEDQLKQNINEDFFDCIPEGLAILDEKLNVLKFNQKILSYLQISEAQFITSTLDSLLKTAQVNKTPQKQKKSFMLMKQIKQNSDVSKQQIGLHVSLSKAFWLSDRIKIDKTPPSSFKGDQGNQFLQSIINDLISKPFNENMTQNSESGAIIKYQVTQELLKKQRHLSIKIHEIQMKSYSNHSVFLIIVDNITKKEQYKQMTNRFNFQQQLLNSFSHELRTPLNCTLSLLQALKVKVDNQDIILNYLNPAVVSCQRLLYQINDILDYAQIECEDFKLNISEFKIKDILLKLKEFFTQECQQKQIQLIVDDDNYFIIKSDKERITQILINLINNSIKFTPQGGRIVISAKKRNQLLYFTVWDNGKGISNQSLSNIQTQDINLSGSQRLYETQHTNKLGLGLKVSRGIIKYLSKNGELIIKSQQGQYTSISFFIENKIIEINEDITDLDSYIKIASKKSVQKCECSQILIVDDVPFNHIALDAMLKNFGLKSESAYDGIQAIEKVKQKLCNKSCCNTYRLIFMDIEMPGKNGFETSKEIFDLLKQNNLSTVLIMCSAYTGEENIEQAKQCGMREIIPKPISLSSLSLLLNRYFSIQ